MYNSSSFKIIISYARGAYSLEKAFDVFTKLNNTEQGCFWEHLLDLIQQSKCDLTDVDRAILTSKVKKTSTCCVIIKKGTFYHNLKRIATLSEKRNALFLLLCLFKQGYQRKLVDNNPAKWWNAEF